MRKFILLISGISLITLFTAGCGTKVERVKTEEMIDVSGSWNDTDARLVAEDMINHALEGGWLENFYKETGRNPIIIVGTVVNRTSEHINPEVFVKTLQSSLLNSGKVTFVAAKDERVEVREERKEQNEGGWTDPSTITPMGKETGADYMLRGSINSVVDEIKGKAVNFYQVNLEMVDLTTNRVVWMEQTETKKYIRRSRFSL